MKRSDYLVGFALALVALTGIGSVAWAGDEHVGGTAEAGQDGLQRFSRKGTLEPGTVISIVNPFGDVRLRRGGDDGAYELNGVLQQLNEGGRRLEIRVEKSEAGLSVLVDWVEKTGAEVVAPTAQDPSRADLVLMVPQAVGAKVVTTDGEIEVKGIASNLQLESISGSIRAAGVQGDINAKSDSGDIHIAFFDRKRRADQHLETVTGSIAVWLDPAAHMDVEMSSSGTLTTDFTLKVEHLDHQEPDKFGKARIGKGGPDVVMKSLRGNLFLRRRVVVD